MADWAGDFGNEYTMRNMFVPDRHKFFQRFLKYEIGSVFEIGCNCGPNLTAWEKLGVDAMGCDVNEGAVRVANAMGLKAYHGVSWVMNDRFDLVFTAGVLIHQQTPELIEVMKEMVRLSERYVMFAEYEGEDEEVPYRGERHALFKREFGRIFESLFPKAEFVESGFVGKELGFDNVTYWMYDISDCASADRISPAARESVEEGWEQEFVVTPSGKVEQVGVS